MLSVKLLIIYTLNNKNVYNIKVYKIILIKMQSIDCISSKKKLTHIKKIVSVAYHHWHNPQNMHESNLRQFHATKIA
jgi:hypothetical protein